MSAWDRLSITSTYYNLWLISSNHNCYWRIRITCQHINNDHTRHSSVLLTGFPPGSAYIHAHILCNSSDFMLGDHGVIDSIVCML